MEKSAVIDETGQYRYSLTRDWDPSKPRICFLMLNGSTADAESDDPTLRRCIGFAKAWGFGTLEVVNLFAYRTTFPDELKRAADPVGLNNDEYIIAAIKRAEKVILAWGVHGQYQARNVYVTDLLIERGVNLWCLGQTKEGHPKHPLYLSLKTVPKGYYPPPRGHLREAID